MKRTSSLYKHFREAIDGARSLCKYLRISPLSIVPERLVRYDASYAIYA
jgi:hypothetical protein